MGTALHNLLSIVTFLPLVGAAVVLCVPEGKLGRGIAFWTSIVTFAVSLGLLGVFDTASTAQFQLETNVPWVKSAGIGYHVGIDGVSLLLILLTTFLMPIVIASAKTTITKRVKEFAVAVLVLETAMLGAFIALDMVLFYVFWELMLIPMFLIIGVWGSENRIYAAVKFFVYTMVGSLLMLVAILYMYWLTGEQGAARSFDYAAFMALKMAPQVQFWLFLAFALAFAVKVPMFPVHTWLPDAHVQAPAPGSVVLAGVLLKMGTYGFYRFAFPFFPSATFELRWLIVTLSVIGIVYGSLMCMAQRDMKKLIAYSSVAHLGFVMLGLSAFTTAGVTGAVYQMLNHGISTGALFLLVGMIYERQHTRLISDYGGIARIVPMFAAVWLIVTLSSIGLPGTNGFVGEFLILSGTFVSKLPGGLWFGGIAATGVVLGAVYMLWMYQRVWQGPVVRDENRKIRDLTLREWAILAPLVALIFVMGLFPTPFLGLAGPSVERFVGHLERANPALAGDPAPSTSPAAAAAAAVPVRPADGVPRPRIEPQLAPNLPRRFDIKPGNAPRPMRPLELQVAPRQPSNGPEANR
ncbi:NADH-quinone oxidoreductase subunit M [Vulgatibacter incomptus]|uniref:NADH-ubiquinone oxidoreductase chain M n=1 Tax=Vulgatibacter incomptus TaxID=1391653 RepID=A0A0K1P838_9BACT|nr:NADH-quinone oxidoreductase subunit M [Vulgatibacter incomptus]AKU89672.1 NADH-ubiquinone oxidoreductase chain M [Vulgatibacter incomptus]